MDPKLRQRLEARLGDGRASGYPDPDVCWEWQMSLDKDGYGNWMIRELGTSRAHRIVWMLLVGEIPDGMVIDHKCRNRPCVNPDHLRVVTKQVNATQNNTGFAARAAARTDCLYGHGPLAVYPYGTRGTRYCPECARIKNLENQRRRRATGVVPQTPPLEWCRKGLHRMVGEDGEPTRDLLVRSDGRRECRGCHRERQRDRQRRLRLESEA